MQTLAKASRCDHCQLNANTQWHVNNIIDCTQLSYIHTQRRGYYNHCIRQVQTVCIHTQHTHCRGYWIWSHHCNFQESCIHGGWLCCATSMVKVSVPLKGVAVVAALWEARENWKVDLIWFEWVTVTWRCVTLSLWQIQQFYLVGGFFHSWWSMWWSCLVHS